MESKEIETVLDSFTGYKYNAEDLENASQLIVLLRKMKALL